jgi:hypothetical protein
MLDPETDVAEAVRVKGSILWDVHFLYYRVSPQAVKFSYNPLNAVQS